MKTKNPVKFWNDISRNKPESSWREYILPQRTPEEFESEGLAQAEWLHQFIKPTDTVIDYGCGIGRITRYIAQLCEKAIGLDISTKFLEVARDRNKTVTNLCFDYVHNYEGVHDIADFIFSIAVVQHNTESNIVEILRMIRTLLKPDTGVAVVNFPQRSSSVYKETSFVKTFSEAEVIAFAESFRSHTISEGNLVHYQGATSLDMERSHEFFLIVSK